MNKFMDIQGIILKEGDFVVVNHHTRYFATLATGVVKGFKEDGQKIIVKLDKFGIVERSKSQEICRITKWTS